MRQSRGLLTGIILLLFAGCLPIELDVDSAGKLLIAREEGWFLLDSTSKQATLLHRSGSYRPVFSRFSPDGQSILLIGQMRTTRDRYELLLVRATGGEGRRLAQIELPTCCRFSPDGRNLALTRIPRRGIGPENELLPELLLIDIESGAVRVLATNVGPLFGWEPDSRSLIALQAVGEEDSQRRRANLVRISAESGESTPIAAVLAAQEYDLDLSRDGERALICALAIGPPDAALDVGARPMQQVFQWNLKTGEVQRSGRTAQSARYSPDGKKILLNGFPVTGPELSVASADFREIHRIAGDAYQGSEIGAGGIAYPGWIDNDRLYYFAERSVYGVDAKSVQLMVVRPDGTERTCLQPNIDAAAFAALP